MNTQKGFTPILLILVGLMLIGGGVYFYFQKEGFVLNNTAKEDRSVSEKQTQSGIDERADYFFQKWFAAWKNLDYSTLSKIFGDKDEMRIYNSRVMMMNAKNNILSYNTYSLYRTISIPISEEKAEVYGYPANTVRVTAFYIVSKEENKYHIFVMSGNYQENKNSAKVSAYKFYSEEKEPMPGLPPEFKPKEYGSIAEAGLQIDKLYSKCITQDLETQFCSF
jgi:hypothetical protein